MSRFVSPPSATRRATALTLLALGTLVSLCGCSSDDTSSPAETVVAATSGTADLSAYCEQVAALDGERPEDYVGSAEHRADVENLIAVAPEAALDPLKVFSAFLSSGAIVPDDPESNVVENWPAAVRAALGEIAAFNDATC